MPPPDDPKKPKSGETVSGEQPIVDLENAPVPDAPTKADPTTPVDLEEGGAGAPPSPPTVHASLPEPISQKPENSNDRARKKIAYWLLAILTGIVVASFILLFWALGSGSGTTENNYKHISGWLNIIYGPVVTLVGSAVGFYFGAQSNQPEDPNPL